MIIGITAEKETGKTTSVQYMMQKLTERGKPFVMINFKDALIEELIQYFPDLLQAMCDTYNNDRATYDGTPWTIERLFREKPPLVRRLMQNWGTDFRRAQDPLYWVHKWYLKACAVAPGTVIFVDDVRFPNEAEAVCSFIPHLLLKLEGVGFPHTGKDIHSSETEMKVIVPDLTIVSTYGDLDGLHTSLNAVVDSVS